MPENYVGRYLGKYEILERLGRGGMAEVLKAYHPALDRFVAIKLLHPFLADDPDFKRRFEAEAQNVAKLRHPNIVHVYDFEFDEGNESYYMVMELIEGPTLKDMLFDMASEGKPLPLEESLRIVGDIGEALAYAHARDMIHRDVKPANIMHDVENSRYVLTDFGIAKIVTGAHGTATTGLLGTPAYMSPEQALGDPGDERSDIYSLGVILYQLCTGRLPYDADTPLAIVLKHVNDPLPNPRDFNPDLPQGVEKVICKAMAKLPGERYQTAQEMVDHLENLDRAARMVVPTTTSAVRDDTLRVLTGSTPILPEGALPQARRRPWVGLGALALIALLALVSIAVAPNLLGLLNPTPTDSMTPPSLTTTLTPTLDLKATADRATLDAVLNAFVTQTAAASETAAAGTALALAATDTPTPTRTPSSTATATVTATPTQTPVAAFGVLAHPDAALDIAFSPDGARVVTAGADGAVRLWEVETGARVRAFAGHGGPVNAVAFNPVAHQLASSGADRTVRLWDEQSGDLLVTLEGHTDAVTHLAFNLYATRLASASADGTVRLWQPDGRQTELVAVLEGHEGAITDIAFSPDGTLLASAGEDGSVWLWDAVSGASVVTLEGHEGAVTDIAFSPPNGDTLASAGVDGIIRLWNGFTGDPLIDFPAHVGELTYLAYSPTGSIIGSAGVDGAVYLWNAATGEMLVALEQHNSPVRRIAFSPDDIRLASAGADGELLLWNQQTGVWLANLAGHTASITAVAFSPDGTVLASASADGTARLWPVPDARPVIIQPTRPPSPTPTSAFTPTPDMTATVAACDYDYELVSQTYDPAFELSPGQFYIRIRRPFTAFITVRNTGECDWERSTALVYAGGERFNAPESVPIPSIVRVGEEYTLEIPLQAPPRNRPHTGVFELRTPAGFLVGQPIEITIYAYYDSGSGGVSPTQAPGGSATPVTPSGGGEPLQFSFFVNGCAYAGTDFVCDITVNPTGGAPPYTVSSNLGGTASSAPYIVPVRSRRCVSFAYTLSVTDSAGGFARQELWFDVEGYASAFPGGLCTTE